MLYEISIENFKCFQKLTLPLANLNVFSGINGMGKSTAIQSILLMKQSQEQECLPETVALNGKYVSLGKGQDVLYEGMQKEEIRFRFGEWDGQEAAARSTWDIQIRYAPDESILPVLNSVYRRSASNDTESLPIPEAGSGGQFESFHHGFEYINAERLAPRTTYEKAPSFNSENSVLGIYGQYTAHYLSVHGGDIVSAAIPTEARPEGEDATLRETVQFWLDQISPNIRLDISEIPRADLAQIGYYYMEPGLPKSNEYRPTNVGFGISYVLPIITAALKALPGSILILENPEAHLHPRGQRKMGELLAWCANRGVQIFVETHSDHVLNGIRISVKRRHIPREAVRLFFFDKAVLGGQIEHLVQTPEIQEDGRLDFWPDGFFDEWDKAQDEIL